METISQLMGPRPWVVVSMYISLAIHGNLTPPRLLWSETLSKYTYSCYSTSTRLPVVARFSVVSSVCACMTSWICFSLSLHYYCTSWRIPGSQSWAMTLSLSLSCLFKLPTGARLSSYVPLLFTMLNWNMASSMTHWLVTLSISTPLPCQSRSLCPSVCFCVRWALRSWKTLVHLCTATDGTSLTQPQNRLSLAQLLSSSVSYALLELAARRCCVFALPRGNVPTAGIRASLVAVAMCPMIQSPLPRGSVPLAGIGLCLVANATAVEIKLELELLGGNPHIPGEAESFAEGLAGGTLCPLFALPSGTTSLRIPPQLKVLPGMGLPRLSARVMGRSIRCQRGNCESAWSLLQLSSVSELSAAEADSTSWFSVTINLPSSAPHWSRDFMVHKEAKQVLRHSQLGPEFSSDCAGDGPICSLKCATLNCGGLSQANVEARMAIIGNWMVLKKLDVLALQDTRLQSDQQPMLLSRIKSILKFGLGPQALGLGEGMSVLICSAQKASRRDAQMVGGQIIILSASLAGCVTDVKQDPTSLGLIFFITLTIKGQVVTVASIYAPFPSGTNESIHRLHNKAAISIAKDGYSGSVYQYLADKLSQIATKHAAPVIIMGDFNSTWAKQNGRFPVQEFSDNLAMRRANTMDATYVTRHAGGKFFAGIDHILYSTHSSLCFIHAEVDRESLMDISDHLPVIGVFSLRTASKAGHIKLRKDTIIFNSKLQKIKYLDIDRSNAEQVLKYQEHFSRLATHSIAEWNVQRDPAVLLQALSCLSSQAVRKSLKRISKARRSGFNPWSPCGEYIRQHICHLQRIQVQLQQLAKPWTLDMVLEIHQELLERLNLSIVDINVSKEDAEWMSQHMEATWTDEDIWIQIQQHVSRLKKLLSYRQHSELSQKIKKAVSNRNKKFKQGTIGVVIQSLTEQYKAPYDMACLPLENGDILVDSRDIHEAHTDFWSQWFKGDESWSGLLSSDWNSHSLLTDRDLFLQCTRGHNIPTDVAHIIWRGLNSTSISHYDQDCIKHRVHSDLTQSLVIPPTLAELKVAIQNLPSASAGGMSGLTYNQLKIWPEHILEVAHKALSAVWLQQTHLDFFKYKWLVPLSKLKEPGDPTLAQLRPIMLIETLRKLWTQLLIKRIRRTLEQQGALSNAQFGFRAKRSTTQPLMQFSAALEQVAEVGGSMAGSTWDVVRAFDSIAKPLLHLALIRIGIPDSWTEYLINLDADSRIVTRTPWAENYVRKHGTSQMSNISKDIPFFFHASRGVGQGDVGSPTIWNVFMDILLCSLQEVDFLPIYMQSMNGSCYKMIDTAYADDLITCSASEEGLQAKADVVSAFSIVMKVSIAIHKLRSFTTREADNSSLIVHTQNWTPCVTPLRNNVDIEYLGVLFHISTRLEEPLYSNAFHKTYSKIRSFLHIIGRKRVHANAKICAATLSILCKMAYVGQFVAWSPTQHKAILTLFSQFYRRALLHLPSFPTRLLYTNLSNFGLNLVNPVDVIQTRKWSILQRLSQGDSMSCDIANVLVGRASRLCRVPWGATKPLIISHVPNAEYWLSSLLLKLEENGIIMSHNAAWATDCLPLPPAVLSSDWAQHLNLLTVNDISFWDGEERILPDSLQSVSIYKKFRFTSMLPSNKLILQCPAFNVPTHEGDAIPILPNQCWMLSNSDSLQIVEILGQDELMLHVHIWESLGPISVPFHATQPLVRLCTPVQGGGSGVFISISRIESHAIRFILSSDAIHPALGIIRSILFSSEELMYRPVRHVQSHYLSDEMARDIRSIPNPIIFSDGSFTQNRQLSGEIGMDVGSSSSGAGVVIISQDPDWETLPQVGIHMNTSRYLTSSFLAELSGLCLSLAIRQDYLPDGVTAISDCKGAISLVSFSKPIHGRSGEALILQGRQRVKPLTVPIWHPSHPERRGGPKCIRDHGIMLADLYANSLQHICSHSYILEPSCLAQTSLKGPSLLKDGLLFVGGLRQTFQDRYFEEYLQLRQHDSRQLYGSWTGLFTRLAVLQWQLSPSSYRRTAIAQRYVWDKLTHPAHPSLSQPLDCPHCGTLSGLEHIVLHCKHPSLVDSRAQVHQELATALHNMHDVPQCQTICMTLELLSRQHTYAIRMWTGLWNLDLASDISTMLQSSFITKTMIRLHRIQILSFLRLFPQGLTHIWRSWRQNIMPVSTTLLAKFPRLQRSKTQQLSIRPFLPTTSTRQTQIRKDILKSQRFKAIAAKIVVPTTLLPAILTTGASAVPQTTITSTITSMATARTSPQGNGRPTILPTPHGMNSVQTSRTQTILTRWLRSVPTSNLTSNTDSSSSIVTSTLSSPSLPTSMHVNVGVALQVSDYLPRAGIG